MLNVILYLDSKDGIIKAIGQSFLFAVLNLSGSESDYSKRILKSIDPTTVYIPKEINSYTSGKYGLIQIDVLHLFENDVLSINLKGHIPIEYIIIQVVTRMFKHNRLFLMPNTL